MIAYKSQLRNKIFSPLDNQASQLLLLQYYICVNLCINIITSSSNYICAEHCYIYCMYRKEQRCVYVQAQLSE